MPSDVAVSFQLYVTKFRTFPGDNAAEIHQYLTGHIYLDKCKRDTVTPGDKGWGLALLAKEKVF